MIWIVGCAVGFAAYRSIAPPRITRPVPLAIVTGYDLAGGSLIASRDRPRYHRSRRLPATLALLRPTLKAYEQAD
jgi:hypothetical protein